MVLDVGLEGYHAMLTGTLLEINLSSFAPTETRSYR